MHAKPYLPFRLLLLSLLCASPIWAGSEFSLVYPGDRCDPVPTPLYFTMVQLETSYAVAAVEPSHGALNLHAQPAEVGSYLPDCERLENAGFDYFQLEGLTSGELTNVVVLWSPGGERQEAAEGGEAGAIFPPWSLHGSGVHIIDVQSTGSLEGNYGFRVDSTQTGASHVSFSFPSDPNRYQVPGAGDGADNNAVVTTIIVRPPDDLPRWQLRGAEQLVYVAGDPEMPGTALRLRFSSGVYEIRAEAAAVTGNDDVETVSTAWCPLGGGDNTVTVEHLHDLDGGSSLLLDVRDGGLPDCEPGVLGFTSARPPADSHLFGALAPQLGGVAFDFDALRVSSVRYASDLRREIVDDFETGGLDPRWAVAGSGAPDITAAAAHTGFWGLEIEPKPSSPSIVKRVLESGATTQDLGCRFSLSGESLLGAPAGPVPRDRFFVARGSGGADQVRLWVRQNSAGHQLRAHSGGSNSGWLALSALPATVDFRWQDGILELWIDGCGPDPQDCASGHVMVNGTPQPVDTVLLGDLLATAHIPEALAVDNVACLVAESGP